MTATQLALRNPNLVIMTFGCNDADLTDHQILRAVAAMMHRAAKRLKRTKNSPLL